METVEIDPLAVKERKADSKGRVAIGPDHAGDVVRIAVLETIDESGD